MKKKKGAKAKEALIHRAANSGTAEQAVYNDSTGSYLSDKGDFGKKGSMQEAYSKEEGYFTMDDDEGKEDERELGDESEEGGATS